LNNWKSKTVLWLNWIWKIRGSTHLVIFLDLKAEQQNLVSSNVWSELKMQ
jgi:hypothetical protein